jgi:hypothetical protein
MGFYLTKEVRLGDLPCPRQSPFFRGFFAKNEKCLELPEMARKMMIFFDLPYQTCVPKNFR